MWPKSPALPPRRLSPISTTTINSTASSTFSSPSLPCQRNPLLKSQSHSPCLTHTPRPLFDCVRRMVVLLLLLASLANLSHGHAILTSWSSASDTDPSLSSSSSSPYAPSSSSSSSSSFSFLSTFFASSSSSSSPSSSTSHGALPLSSVSTLIISLACICVFAALLAACASCRNSKTDDVSEPQVTTVPPQRANSISAFLNAGMHVPLDREGGGHASNDANGHGKANGKQQQQPPRMPERRSERKLTLHQGNDRNNHPVESSDTDGPEIPVRHAASAGEAQPPPLPRERSSSVSSARARLDTAPMAAGAVQRPPTDVVYSVTVGDGASARANSVSNSERSTKNNNASPAVKYTVLEFQGGGGGGGGGAQDAGPNAAGAALAAALSSASALASSDHDDRNEVYGNAASILTSVVVPRSAVDLSDRIDGGQFGDVFKGTLRRTGGEALAVAVKAVRMDATDERARTAFLEETSTMAQLRHQNVVQLLAVVAEPLLLVMEFINEGTVLAYVRAHPSPPLPVLLHIASNCAQGLVYLHAHKVIHRDVAARNVLLQGSKSEFVAKLGDLGMARVGDHYKSDPETPLPIRWCAPESVFYGNFAFASDVWSFGVFMWELVANGQFPYPDFVSDSDLMNAIETGLRAHAPPGACKDFYDVMMKCWEMDVERRPTMKQVADMLGRVQRVLNAIMDPIDPKYEAINPDMPCSDLITFTRFVCPAVFEYRAYSGTLVNGLYERVETFDGDVYRPANARSTELFEMVTRRPTTVYAPIMTDELRPPGNLYVMRDKGSARSELTRRKHLYRTALECRKADPDVYRVVNKTKSSSSLGSSAGATSPTSPGHDRAKYTVPVPINLPSDEHDEGESPTRSRTNTEVFSNPAETGDVNNLYRKPERRRTVSQSQAEANGKSPEAPPLPVRASFILPASSTGVEEMLSRGQSQSGRDDSASISRSSSSSAHPVGTASLGGSGAVVGTIGSARGKTMTTQALTANEWSQVQVWLSRSISRTQAEQILNSKGTDGSYLVRRSERVYGEFALSLKGGGIVNHYRLIQMEDEQIAMFDAVNGNRTFASMQSLLAFYKLLPPEAIGGLAAQLGLCVPP